VIEVRSGSILHDVACAEIYCYTGMHYGLTEQYTMEKLLMHTAFNLSLSTPITSSVHKHRGDIFTLLCPRNMQRKKAVFSGATRSCVNCLYLYADFKKWDSYTRAPNKFGVRNAYGRLLP
jgi:hypothetical protein